MKLYFIRHAESMANVGDILAGQMDFPLSPKGMEDAAALARQFFPAARRLTRIISSPLLRARQTAEPFARLSGVPVAVDARLTEQHLGRFSGMTYARLKTEAGYMHDRTRRWDWVPDGGGESYQMIAARVADFLRDLQPAPETGETLIVTHAVAMRLIYAVLTRTLPRYPDRIADNGEIWAVDFHPGEGAHRVDQVSLGGGIGTAGMAKE